MCMRTTRGIAAALVLATSIMATSIMAAPVPGNLISSEVEQAGTGVVEPGATGPQVIRAQILLDRARFSPGEIDGRYGGDLVIAIKGYQENHGLKPTGVIDAEMWKSLNTHTGPLLVTYTILAADVKGPFEKIPKTAAEQAEMKWMGYESPAEGLGEKFHMSPNLLAELNPGKKLDTAGEQIIVAECDAVSGEAGVTSGDIEVQAHGNSLWHRRQCAGAISCNPRGRA
jgi:peptidoglycan hydrolase-like protein with peptidoglycan-binding domain